MPELPEVETVRRGLEPQLKGQKIVRVETMRPNLRRAFPANLAESLEGAKVTKVGRRAKYLLIETDRNQTALVHLGMSGKLLLRQARPNQFDKHDHLALTLADGRMVIFNDARRFGLWELTATLETHQHPLLAHLGPEPWNHAFDVDYLHAQFSKRSGPVKPALMDQRLVVGVGNIYASEALFRIGMHPATPGKNVSLRQSDMLISAIRAVLEEAIASGGSTLRDYVRSDGDVGYFQHHFAVYGRAGKPCTRCGTAIEAVTQAGRTTFFCPSCQLLPKPPARSKSGVKKMRAAKAKKSAGLAE